jgi:protein-disulfide isomerase
VHRIPALVTLLMALAVAGCGTGEPARPVADAHRAARTNAAVVAGLPQDGITLGRLDAPATLTMYAATDDIAAGFFRDELPTLVKRLVRPGRIRIQVRTIPAVNGAPSGAAAAMQAARTAQAVGLQDKLWQFYAALGTLAGSSSSAEAQQQALAMTPGLDAAQVRRDARSPRVAKAVERARAYAAAAGADSLPAFRLRLGDGPDRPVPWSCAGCLAGAVAKAVGAGAPAPA